MLQLALLPVRLVGVVAVTVAAVFFACREAFRGHSPYAALIAVVYAIAFGLYVHATRYL